MSIICMNQDYVFEVKFNFQRNNNFICTRDSLIEVLKTYDQNGIKSIKLNDGNSFKRISKRDMLALFNHDSESILYLKDHYYFR